MRGLPCRPRLLVHGQRGRVRLPAAGSRWRSTSSTQRAAPAAPPPHSYATTTSFDICAYSYWVAGLSMLLSVTIFAFQVRWPLGQRAS